MITLGGKQRQLWKKEYCESNLDPEKKDIKICFP